MTEPVGKGATQIPRGIGSFAPLDRSGAEWLSRRLG